jgi:very-short-patch-repair endonuclease
MILKLDKKDLIILKLENADIVKNYIQKLIKNNYKKTTPKKKSKVKNTDISNSATRRENLIKNQTNSEKIIKAKLKALKIEYEFQKIIYVDHYYYIVDFYLPKQHLILEIDGGYHNTFEQKDKDAGRTLDLKLNKYPNLKRLTNSRAEEISLPSLLEFINKN